MLLATLLLAPAVQAQYDLELLVDQEILGLTPQARPFVSQGKVAFSTVDLSRIYEMGASGIASVVEETGNKIPGASEDTFSNVGLMSYDGKSYSWNGTSGGFQSGVYFQNPNRRVALSGYGSNRDIAGLVAEVDGNNVVWTSGPDTRIDAWREGNKVKIADTSTRVPEGFAGENFRNFMLVDIAGEVIVFGAAGNMGSLGIYYDAGEGLKKLVDQADMAPGSGGPSPFAAFGGQGPVTDGKNVVFFAEAADGREGLYISRNLGAVEVIAEKTPGGGETLPDGPYRVDRMKALAISDGNIALVAWDEDELASAMYVTEDGSDNLVYVIGSGDELDGKVIDAVAGTGQMRDGDTLAVGVRFKSGAFAIYWTGAPVVAINPGMNDAWYNPATDGQGIFIIVYPSIPLMFVAWFTYETDAPEGAAHALDQARAPLAGLNAVLGDDDHRWLTAAGAYAGNSALLDITNTRGGRFDAGDPVERETVGTIEVIFEDCKAGVVRYSIPSINRTGEVPIQRVANDNVALCEALAYP